MMQLIFALAVALPLAAQSGAYHFVQLSLRGPGTAIVARNGGGTLTITGSEAVFAGQAGSGGLAATPLKANGTLRDGVLSNPLVPGESLRILANADASILLGSSAGASTDSYDLLVALRQGPVTRPLQGTYNAAYFAVRNSRAEGLTTAFLDFTAAPGMWRDVRVIGHTAAIDDVNREETAENAAYTADANGKGTVRFSAPSDLLTGDRELMVSPDGALLLGYSLGAGGRDILVGLRRDSDRASQTLDGLYQISELTAEAPFAFSAADVHFSAAAGILRSNGYGRAEIEEQISGSKGAALWLATANAYYADPSGRAAFVPELTADRRRNNVNFTSDALVGAHAGVPGELTLEHGIWVGMRAPGPTSAVVLTHIGPAAGTASAQVALMTVYGTNLASYEAKAPEGPRPRELAGVKVLVNGAPVAIQSISPTQVTFEWPATVAAATVQVSAAAGQSNSLQVPLLPSTRHQLRGLVLHKDFSPIAGAAPARAGESLLVFAIAPDKDVTVTIAGRAATVESLTPVGNFPGAAIVQVKVPSGVAASRAAAVGIATSSSFTDVLEIPLAP